MWNKDHVQRFEKTLLHTGMMNQEFIDQIACGEVSEEYVVAALNNFRKAQSAEPYEVEVEYVVGFMFSHDEKNVLLVYKNRPAWQAGKLNGIGGKVEAGETPEQAMQREFTEETGFIAKRYMNALAPAELERTPTWKMIGTRGRPALSPKQPGSYKMYIFACHFDIETCLPTAGKEVRSDAATAFTIDRVEDFSTDEPIVNVAIDWKSLAERGVPGLVWTVNSAQCALNENFMIEVNDPANMDFIE